MTRLYCLLYVLFFSIFLSAKIPTADRLYEKGLYRQALAEYLKFSKKNEHDEALVKSIQCHLMLKEFEKAVILSESKNTFSDPKWKAIFQVIKYLSYQKYIQVYGYNAPSEELSDNQDIKKRTYPEWLDLKNRSLANLASEKETLIKLETEKFPFLFFSKNTNFELAPTIWDVVFKFMLSTEKNAIPIQQIKGLLDFSVSEHSLIRKYVRESYLFEKFKMDNAWLNEEFLITNDQFEVPITQAPENELELSKQDERLETFLSTVTTNLIKSQIKSTQARRAAKRQDFESAVKLCKESIQLYSGPDSSVCLSLTNVIQQKQVENLRSFFTTQNQIDLEIKSRNIKNISLYIYSPSETSFQRAIQKLKINQFEPLGDDQIKSLLKKKPNYDSKATFNYEKPHLFSTAKINIGKLGPGIYKALVIENNESNKPFISGFEFSVSDIKLVYQEAIKYSPEKAVAEKNLVSTVSHHFYVFDLNNSRLKKNVDVFAILNGTESIFKSNDQGKVEVKESFSFVPLVSNINKWKQISAVAFSNGSVSSVSTSRFPIFNSLVKFIIQTDRPIYRPGQSVKVKILGFERVPYGYSLLKNNDIEVVYKDANGKVLNLQKLRLGTTGSVASDFLLPMKGLLGSYSISVTLTDSKWQKYEIVKQFNKRFNVEEYKRPDYFIEISKNEGSLVYNQKAKIKIKGRYYYGAPLKGAKGTYTLASSAYIPWDLIDFKYDDQSNATSSVNINENLQGEFRLNDQGEFDLEWTPKNSETIAKQYLLSVSVLDESGRSIDEKANFFTSINEFFIQSEWDRTFFKANQPIKLQVSVKNLNEKIFDQTVQYEIFQLRPPTEEQIRSIKKKRFLDPMQRFRFNETELNFNVLFSDLVGDAVGAGAWSVQGDTNMYSLPPLKEGVYRVKLSCLDSFKNRVQKDSYVLVVQDGKILSKFYFPAFTLLSKKEYTIGDVGESLIGGDGVKGDIVRLIEKNQFLIDEKIIKGSETIRLDEFAVTNENFGGSSYQWFSIVDSDLITQNKILSVEYKYKRFLVNLNTQMPWRPGQNTQLNWMVDKAIHPVDSLIRIYDQSLEYYSKSNESVFENLYFNHDNSQASEGTPPALSSYTIPWDVPDFKKMLDKFKETLKTQHRPVFLAEPEEVAFNDESSGAINLYSRGGGFLEGNDMMSKAAFSAPSVYASINSGAPAMASLKGISNRDRIRSDEKQTAEGVISRVQKTDLIRNNFSETAVFEPHLDWTVNQAKHEFKTPDSLTAWTVKAFAVTENADLGLYDSVVTVKKDIFVRILSNRFFREGDRSDLKLKIDNHTKNTVMGHLILELKKDDKVADDFLGKQSLIIPVSIPSDGAYTHTWKINIPNGVGKLKVVAQFKNEAGDGSESDAEERIFSILPSRQRLVESRQAYLTKNETELKLKSWDEKDPTRESEQMIVQLDPQTPIMLLSSIPNLINSPFSCTEQLINKYVPLAIVNQLYQKDPALKKIMDQFFLKRDPNLKTLLLPWDDKDSRRFVDLIETPWVDQAQGFKTDLDLISLLDTKTVEAVKNHVYSEIKSRQNQDGGFAWLNGGRSDLYITLLVLEGIAEAKKYGVSFSLDRLQSALEFIYKELPKYLHGQVSELAFVVYGTYILTSFDFGDTGSLKKSDILKVWIPFIEKYEALLTPLGHGYMAYIYHRMQNTKKMSASIHKALDRSKKDNVSGVYWAPEDQSWLWYRDTVEKHAFFLQMLADLNPKDERLDGLAQWLLMSRKGSQWSSVKSTAKAIYSLARYLRIKGLWSDETSYKISWGNLVETVTISPMLNKEPHPLKWTKENNFSSNVGKVKIEKAGNLPTLASFTWIYSTENSGFNVGSDMVSLKRDFYVVNDKKLVRLKGGSNVKIGQEVEVQLSLMTKLPLDYLYLKDPRGAGFEAANLLTGYQWQNIPYFQEPRDSVQNFYIDHLPKGEFVLKHRFKATLGGTYKFGSAVIQSMYAPDIASSSAGFELNVTE